MSKFVWSRETSNAVANCMEDIEAAQTVLDEGNGDEANRMVTQAVTRFTESLKGLLMHVGVGFKVELGLITAFFELRDFSDNEVELRLKARRVAR